MQGINPFVALSSTGETIDARDMRLDGARVFSEQGELNASDRKDYGQRIQGIMAACARGEVGRADPQTRTQRHQAVLAASQNPAMWQALGSDLASAIKQQGERQSICRRVLNYQVLEAGQDPKIPTIDQNGQAVVAVGAAEVEYQLIRNKIFRPTEFSIQANVQVENIELQQIGSDILQDAFNQGNTGVTTVEDKLWKKAADATVGLYNSLTWIGGKLTPDNLGALQQQVTDHNLPVSAMIMANDYWTDIIGSPSFWQMFDPVTRYDLVLNGRLGTLLGMEIITDGFRAANQRVLDKGDIYVVSQPEYHGSYTDRGGVAATATDGSSHGRDTKGWFMTEYFSLAIANARSVAVGRRLAL